METLIWFGNTYLRLSYRYSALAVATRRPENPTRERRGSMRSLTAREKLRAFDLLFALPDDKSPTRWYSGFLDLFFLLAIEIAISFLVATVMTALGAAIFYLLF